MDSQLIYFQSATLAGLKHGFFGRTGGVSSGVVSSLNTYPYNRDSGKEVDEIKNVNRNRQVILQELGVSAPNIVTANQAHGDKIIHVNSLMPLDFADADGLITDVKNVPIGILTADCVPIIYTDINHNLIGVVHAGWKGAFLDIHFKMLLKFNALGILNSQIKVAIGPSIQQPSYEVDTSFFKRWLSKSMEYSKYFCPSNKNEFYKFNLPGVIFDELRTAKIFDVDWVRLDTLTHEKLFFSHRRATLSGKLITGRQLSVVSL